MKLYSSYMVASSGAARHKYDELLVAANGWCPFCGGIGHVKTLDHYLPKANFPLYSIVPTNLVPCCRDCNSGKSNTFPTNANRQTIHPYLDGSHFFSERWISATASQTEPISVQFQAKPPLDWSAADRQRAICHFDDYKLATRYSIEAGAEISTIERARKTTFKDFASGELKQHLIEQGQNPSRPINGWHRTLYTALADTDWFLEGVPL
ncbi:HNH endonuclease [Hyphomonas sp.]|uniref:HNH endonuclease n=1 Tax=Hyphomonas sp. TaxID=87 RepID=UPI0032EB1304